MGHAHFSYGVSIRALIGLFTSAYFYSENMAREPWNRVNIPFPSAVSSVRIPFNSTTGRVYCTRNIISFSCHYLLINLAIWNPRGGAWVHVRHCGIVVELRLLLSCRCESQSRVGWEGQCAQANPERDSPDGDPSYVRAAARPKQQPQGQQDLPRRKAGEVLVCTQSLLMKTWHQ